MWFRLSTAEFTTNIGTMNTWSITRVLGTGVTYSGNTSVDKGASFSATVTLTDTTNYKVKSYTVTMDGVDITSSSVTTSDNITYNISIASVTGSVKIHFITENINTGEEDSGSSGGTSGGGSTTPDANGIITLSNFSVATKSDGTTKYLKAEDGCMIMAFNVETNTNYSVIDTGTHNRFRFYGRTTKDSSSDMVANLEFDGIIGDQNSVSGIDTWYDYTFNSGEYQTVYVYLSTSSSNAPALTVTKQTNSTAINMLQSRGFKTVDSVKTLYNAVNCITAAVNVTTNTNYKIVDNGTHNRFRFYGRTTSDDVVTMHTDLLAMDGIIADTSNVSGIDSLSEYTINTGNYQTIYIYLVGDSTSYSPNITITEV